MEIERLETKIKNFSQIKSGDAFLYNDVLYLKLANLHPAEDNAAVLESGKTFCFSKIAQVLPVKAKVVMEQ